MVTWTLVIWIHVGMLSDKDSMALTTVPNFKSEAACETAGKHSESLVKRTRKEYKYVCLKVD
jgi:hypothetical protein